MRWKRFLGICVVLIIALMAVVYVFLANYNYNKLKPHLAQMVKDATGRDLNLVGELDLAIGLSPAMVVTCISLANAPWGSQPRMFRVEKLQAQVRLLPLLKRDLEVNNIRLAGVDVLLETDPNGKSNWDFIAGERKGKIAETFIPIEIDVDKIHIEKLRFIFHESKTGSKSQYRINRLEVARSETDDQLSLGLKADYDSRPITLSGKIGRVRNLFTQERFPLNLSGTFSNTTVKFDGAIDDLSNLTGIDLKLDASGRDLSEIGPIIGQKLPKTDQFAFKGRLTGSAKALSLREAHGIARRDSMRLNLTGAVKNLLTLNGMDLQSRLNGGELAEMGAMFGSDLPDLGPFEVSAKLSGSSKAIALHDFSAMVENSDFQGLVKVAFLKRPKITVNLESSVIDFTALMKSLENGKQEPADKEKQKRRLFSDAPLPLDFFKKLDADIVLNARNIHAKDARLDFGRMALKLKNHDFSIDKLEATYKETKISGNLQITAGTPSQVATHFLVQNFNLGDFLKETGRSDQVRAIIDIAAHGKSRGDSVQSLMANLDGSIGAVMGEGYLTKYLDTLSSGLTDKVFKVWKPNKAVDQIKCAVLHFDIKAGVAASQAFIFNTQAGILAGEGNINLGTEKINFLLVPKPAHPDLSILNNLRVSGSVIDPQVGVDKTSALTQGAKSLSFLAVGPLGLLAPFVHLGANKAHPCDVPSIEQLGLNSADSE